MDGLCLNARLMTPAITVSEVRTNATNVAGWGFSFKYPLRSLWPGVYGNRFNAMTTDDTVLVEDDKKLVDQNTGNWVFKFLRFRSFRNDEETISENNQESKVEEKKDDDEDDQRDKCSCEEECNVCDDDDENKVELDKKSFSEMLRRVTLAEARLYAQMSYLGSLAYSIPQIKVPPSLPL